MPPTGISRTMSVGPASIYIYTEKKYDQFQGLTTELLTIIFLSYL